MRYVYIIVDNTNTLDIIIESVWSNLEKAEKELLKLARIKQIPIWKLSIIRRAINTNLLDNSTYF